jgi:hypothetical protein
MLSSIIQIAALKEIYLLYISFSLCLGYTFCQGLYVTAILTPGLRKNLSKGGLGLNL